MKRVILYLRVSSPEQHTHIQKQQCIEYVKANNYKLIDIIEEKKSGYKNNENRFLYTFIQNLKNTNNFDTLLIYSYDRFSRNLIDGLEMINALENKNIVVESVIDNIDYSTPFGRKMLVEKFAICQYESDLISFRVKKSCEFKRTFGLYVGNCPFGKKIDPIKKTRLINNEEEQKIITFIKKAKRGGSTSEELTNIIKSIVEIEDDDVVGWYDKDNNLVNPARPMTNSDIAGILNDFNVKKRKRSWSSSSVRGIK